ncbi:MAG TPA: aldo/keto reductase [Thermoplasmata archaeon]|nr:aldo/keto reductase [Thermoplasmata archaeon]
MNESVPTSLSAGYRLNQGPLLPCLGLGVFQVEPGATTRQAVSWALEAGYRHVDTAKLYENEADVGEAVRASGIPRSEVFVTTKLWHTDHGFETALAAFRASLGRLNLGYVDLYLIHWPTAPSPEARRDSWRALERIQTQGLARAIGVSNYTVRHLEELREHSDVVPAVDQVEMHPFVYDPDLLEYCARHGIRVEAYSPLTRGRQLGHPAFAEVAKAHGRSPAQVLIRWGIQHGMVELPRSIRRERIHENARVFDFSLTAEEMARLDGLRGGPRVTVWNPALIP